ncbi:MAG TPA: polysaccharide deacetylase family protein [Azospirillaceae bacterium]|nr:polysaccharide deacetylase family protein [Azospirillaceae bacterium]
MRKLVGAVVRWSGFSAGARALCARRRITMVVYHDPAPDVLDRHLAYYTSHYTVIDMNTVEMALLEGRWDRLPPYPLVITLDDGHRGNAALAEVFRRYRVRPIIYLSSQVVGTQRPFWWQTDGARQLGIDALKRLPDHQRRACLAEVGTDPERPVTERQALTWDEVREMAAVADFGGHTRTHPILPRCADSDCHDEIAGSKAEVEAAVGVACRHFAYPNGDHGDREAAYLREAGYATARGTRVGWIGPEDDPYRLKGIVVSDEASVDWLVVQLTGLPGWLRQARRRRRRTGQTAQGHPAPVAG